MEGTNQLLQDQIYKIVERTMGVHDSDADKNSFWKYGIFPLRRVQLTQVKFPAIHQIYFHFHQIH